MGCLQFLVAFGFIVVSYNAMNLGKEKVHSLGGGGDRRKTETQS